MTVTEVITLCHQPPARGQRALTWVVLDEGLVQAGQLVRRDVPAGVVGGLEVQVVLARPEELRSGHVHANDHLVSVAGFPDGVLQQLQSWRGGGGKVGNQAGEREVSFNSCRPGALAERPGGAPAPAFASMIPVLFSAPEQETAGQGPQQNTEWEIQSRLPEAFSLTNAPEFSTQEQLCWPRQLQ